MKDIISFGDSFVNIFYPLNDNIRIIKYKGATIKGLINRNDNYQDILDKLRTRYKYGFFVFGQVDFFFYYYYKKYLMKEKNILKSMYDNAINYIKLIKDLPNIENKYVFGILPRQIKTNNYKKILTGYGIFTEENINLVKNYNLIKHNKRIQKYNSLLEKYCNQYNITFCNIFDYITTNLKINKLFCLSNDLNIHLNFEYLLVIYVKYKLQFLLQYHDMNELIKLCKNSYNSYLESKTHKVEKKHFFSSKKIKKFILLY